MTDQDRDLEIPEIRHVVTDHDGTHLLADEDADEALCGYGAGGLRAFGQAADNPRQAALLGAWININPGVCEDCRDTLNDHLFDCR